MVSRQDVLAMLDEGSTVDEIVLHIRRWLPTVSVKEIRAVIDSIVNTRAAAGRNFDENKHKRDEAGRWAKKEGRGVPSDETHKAPGKWVTEEHGKRKTWKPDKPETAEERFSIEQQKKRGAKTKKYEKHGLATGAFTKEEIHVTEDEVFEANELMIKLYEKAVEIGLMPEGYYKFPPVMKEHSRAIRGLVQNKYMLNKFLSWAGNEDPKVWNWVPPIRMYNEDRTESRALDETNDFFKFLYKGEVGLTTMSPEKYLYFSLGTASTLDVLRQKTRAGKASMDNIHSLVDSFKRNNNMSGAMLELNAENQVVDQEGNHRSFAAAMAGIEEVPVMIVNHYKHLTPEQIKHLSIEYDDWMKPRHPGRHYAGTGAHILKDHFGAKVALLELNMTLAAAGRAFEEHKHKRDEKGRWARKWGGWIPDDTVNRAPVGDPLGIIKKEHKTDFKRQSYKVSGDIIDMAIANRTMEDFSADPIDGIMYNAFEVEDALALYKKYGNGTDPVYFVAITNNGPERNSVLENAYNHVQDNDLKPFFGRWVSDETGKTYLDISFPVDNAIDGDSIIQLLKAYDQESALIIDNNGEFDFLKNPDKAES